MGQTCIIIGASHGGSQAAISVRQAGWDGDIILIGDEAFLPYHHPPLSKDFLSGNKELSDITIRPSATYEAACVQTKLNTRIEKIDRQAKTITTTSGDELSYDKLILCTGARPRPLPIDGADLDGVFYLRDAADVMKIKEKVTALAGKDNAKAVIIGGGYIGLETAASLTKLGMSVSVLEMADRILQRVTAPVMSGFYKRIHSEEGVEISEACVAQSISKTDDGLVVHASTGDFVGDMVIVGIGVIPNTELAEAAGLTVGNGIVVDAMCKTSDDDIYAAGDVTWHHNPIYNTDLRLESVPNATDQAKIIAGAITGGAKEYNALPWFWSDQFDLKLQIAGLSGGFDEVVIRGDHTKGRSFAAFYFKNDNLLAVDAVNRPQEYMVGRRLITMGKTVDKTALADEAIGLKSFLK